MEVRPFFYVLFVPPLQIFLFLTDASFSDGFLFFRASPLFTDFAPSFSNPCPFDEFLSFLQTAPPFTEFF